MRKILLAVGALIGSCGLFVCLLFAGVMYATRGVATAGNDFMTALREDQYSLAYNMLHPGLQSEFDGHTQFEAYFLERGIRVETWRFSNRSVNNSEGELSGMVVAGERRGSVRLSLIYEDERWMIAGFNFRPNNEGE